MQARQMLIAVPAAAVVAGIGDPGEGEFPLKPKILDLPLKWPIVDFGHQSSAKRIFPHVLPFLTVALARSQNMIEEFSLPDGQRKSLLANNTFARPLLPKLHELGQWFCLQFARTEEVHVIRHDDITADRPAMSAACVLPFLNQNCSRLCRRKNWPMFRCAGRDEVDGLIDPNSIESAQVTMHALFVAGIADPGEGNVATSGSRDQRSQPQHQRFILQTGITDPGHNKRATTSYSFSCS